MENTAHKHNDLITMLSCSTCRNLGLTILLNSMKLGHTDTSILAKLKWRHSLTSLDTSIKADGNQPTNSTIEIPSSLSCPKTWDQITKRRKWKDGINPVLLHMRLCRAVKKYLSPGITVIKSLLKPKGKF